MINTSSLRILQNGCGEENYGCILSGKLSVICIFYAPADGDPHKNKARRNVARLRVYTLFYTRGYDDIWQFTPGQVTYKVSTAYATLTIAPEIIPAIKWLWKTCCQLKHKIFFWLLLNDRINTRALLQRKGFFLQDYTCVMCNLHALETRDHLFFHCQFAQLCWSYICTNWQPAHTGIQEEISNLKQLLSVPYAMEIIILTCWAIWTTRNDHIFQHIQPSIYRCRKKLKEELK